MSILAPKAWLDTKTCHRPVGAGFEHCCKRKIYKRANRKPAGWKVLLSKVNGETFEIKRRIKNEIIFRQFNLLDDFPFKKEFHVIFCRNVMIYFDYDAKMNILEKFYKFLEPGGYLFIGHSESINVNESEFKYVMPSVYRKPN